MRVLGAAQTLRIVKELSGAGRENRPSQHRGLLVEDLGLRVVGLRRQEVLLVGDEVMHCRREQAPCLVEKSENAASSGT